MPVYSERELIPFVNQLETQLSSMNSEVNDWKINKNKVLKSLETVEGNQMRAVTAMVKADEALAEIGTATFDIVAQRGQRLKKLIEGLKSEMVEIAKNTEGAGGAGFDKRINGEIDNAVSSVDSVVDDGLKLDYRLRQILDVARKGERISEKEMVIPYVYEVSHMDTLSVQVIDDELSFIDGDVMVLDENGRPILMNGSELLVGSVTNEGVVTLSGVPNRSVKLYFPVEAAFNDVPKDVLYLMMNMMVQKNSEYMKDIVEFKTKIDAIGGDIKAMKGENWTVDFSIMRNHKEIVKESITPKSLQVQVEDGVSTVSYSYKDHESLSHFVLERWDSDANAFVPFDGEDGIISK